MHGLQIFDLQASQKRSFCAQAAAYKTYGFVKRSCASEAEQPVGLLSEAEQAAERSSVTGCLGPYGTVGEAVRAKPEVLQDLRGHYLGHVVTLLSKL